MSVSEALAGAVDFAVGLVSPRRAVIRKHFRRMGQDGTYRETVLAAVRARGYRAANAGRNGTPWGGSNTSADSEIRRDLPSLRSKSRELNRDDPIGSGVLENFAREIVGTELRAQALLEDEAKELATEKLWTARKHRGGLTQSDRMPLGAWQFMAVLKWLEDGEAFVKRAIADVGEPVWFEVPEAERVATPLGVKPQDERGEIRDGIEKDRHGRVVAYWILKRHPGDQFTSGSQAATREAFDRVPEDAVTHLKFQGRPGQTRGVPFLHAVLQDIRDLDLLMLASLKRCQVAACFSLFITSTASVTDLLEVTAENYGYQLDQDIVPGSIFKLFPGETVTTVSPNFPSPELEQFVIMLARRIGTALGVSWQTILRDWAKSNYSSARTSLLADRQVFTIMRERFCEQVLEWMWATVMQDGVIRGELAPLDEDELCAVQWVADPWQWIDPLKEGQALEIRRRLGLSTLKDMCAAEGKDWKVQLRQKLLEEKAERELRDELGLPPPEALEGTAVTGSPQHEDQVNDVVDERPENEDRRAA